MRGQQSDLSDAFTSYALPSILRVFPNGTTPALGERKTVVCVVRTAPCVVGYSVPCALHSLRVSSLFVDGAS